MTEIRSILFASDLSPESDRAYEHARFLAERFGAGLTIYHALEMSRTEHAGSVDVDDDRRAQWERTVREELSRRTSTLTIPHEVVVDRRAYPAKMISAASFSPTSRPFP